MRIGLGSDFHRLVKGRKLHLGGLLIPHTHGLQGHSDADLVLHALIDAILGALGEGDIGEWFPDKDKKYQGTDSKVLLKTVLIAMKKKKYVIGNVDIIIEAEAPKLKQHKLAMRASIAKLLGVKQGLVNIKAKTREGLEAVGQKKAMSAQCIVLLKSKRN